ALDEADETVTVTLTGVVDVLGPPATFTGRQPFTTGNGPRSVAEADLNGDGRLDLISADRTDSTLSVLLNTTSPGAATPTFAARQTVATGTSPSAVAVADLNGDGRPDLVSADNGSNQLSVFLNTTPPGATTFAFGAAQTFATGTSP